MVKTGGGNCDLTLCQVIKGQNQRQLPPHAHGRCEWLDCHVWNVQVFNILYNFTGQYPNEDQEDFYERKIKEREREWVRDILIDKL